MPTYPKRRTILYWLLVTLYVALIIIIAISVRIYRSYDVSNRDAIMNNRDSGLMLYDRNGELFFAFNRARPRIAISLTDVPLHTQQAIIAAEDKEFYAHKGFSSRGIIRSLYLNTLLQRATYGASTITQQLVKNSLLTTSKSISRKFQEIIIAIKLERHYEKRDILEMYINSAYFGEGVFGIEAAAQTYFNKEAKQLTLGESAILAGLLPAPAALSPLVSDEADVKERQRIVLELMQELVFITPQQKQAAREELIVFQKRDTDINQVAPHFALMVKQELDRAFGEEVVIRSGMHVTTTLDLAWQKHAETTTKNHIDSLRNSGAGNGAAVVLDPKTGEIVSLVGSVGWFQEGYGKANMAISPRQTGSAFKPIVYAAALQERTITAATVLHDIPTTFSTNYKPKNYDNRWRGNVTVRRALANSLNVPAVEAIMKVGIPRTVTLAKKLGISTMSEHATFNPSTALGAESISLLELTAAYGTFANGGTLQPPHAVTSIRDKYDREILWRKKLATNVISPQVSFIISSMLSDNRARSEVFGNLLTISRPAAVKTGTTQEYRDGWTVGYTPNLAVGVWMGNNDNTPMQRVPASTGAAPFWKNLMEYYLAQLPQEEFLPPTGITTRTSCTKRTVEYFIPGTEPSRYCPPTPTPESPDPSPTPPDTTPQSAVPEVREESRERNARQSYQIPSSIEELLLDQE